MSLKCTGEFIRRVRPRCYYQGYLDEVFNILLTFHYCFSDAIEASMANLSVEAREKAAKDAAKKEAKAEAAEAKAASVRSQARVTIKRIERNKRKFVTSVSGLETFGLDLKKVGRDFGKKFATGSSVTKTPQGGEEIVVQGDVSDEIYDLLVDSDKYVGKISEDNIECVDDRKKKKG